MFADDEIAEAFAHDQWQAHRCVGVKQFAFYDGLTATRGSTYHLRLPYPSNRTGPSGRYRLKVYIEPFVRAVGACSCCAHLKGAA